MKTYNNCQGDVTITHKDILLYIIVSADYCLLFITSKGLLFSCLSPTLLEFFNSLATINRLYFQDNS